MAVKNTASKTWSITPSYDGLRWSAWPAGDKPGGNPVIVYMDFIAGPTTGGEGNNGCYLSIYGFNFGNFSDYGVTNHLTFGGVEVANYRCLVSAVGSGTSGHGNGVYETFGIKRLTVQVGALGTPTAGTPLDIELTVQGRTLGNRKSGSTYYDYLDTGQALRFTPQPGAIVFVDPASGNNSNIGTFASPLHDLQSANALGGALYAASANNTADGVKPGTHVILRGGTYAPVSNTSQLNYGSWANIYRISGTSPTGASNRGPICVTSYPGAAGANAPELAFYSAGTGISAAGGFLGNDTTRQAETNPYDGLTGWGRWMHFSNLKIACAPDGPANGAPFNLNSSADYWRIVNCEGSWNSTITGGAAANTGAVAGNGYHVRIAGNYFHDVNGDTSLNQNHGVNLNGTALSANDVIVAWNCIKNIGAGSGIRTNNVVASDYILNVVVHNNWIESVQKHGLSISTNTRTRLDYNNVVLFSGEAGINFSATALNLANALKVFNNTVYGFARVVTSQAAILNTSNTGTGSTDVRNNIIHQSTGSTGTYTFVSLDVSGTNNLSTNRWYDDTGHLTTVPSADSTGTYGTPSFTSTGLKDFSLTGVSACIDIGGTPLSTRTFDFLGFGAPVNSVHDAGAFEYGAHY